MQILAGILGLLALLYFGGQTWVRWYKARELKNAYRLFLIRREQLEARFFDVARSLGKPRGLRWLECRWQKQTSFGRDRKSGLITAFVAVNISFEAIPGEEMEDVAAVSTLRDATALFHYQYGNWGTGGRALFNMDPDSALSRLHDQYESIAFQAAP